MLFSGFAAEERGSAPEEGACGARLRVASRDAKFPVAVCSELVFTPTLKGGRARNAKGNIFVKYLYILKGLISFIKIYINAF